MTDTRHSLRCDLFMTPATMTELRPLTPKLDTFHLFAGLPREIKLLVLSKGLVSEKPIMNPGIRRALEDEGFDYPKYYWSDQININILATCKDFHQEGMTMLYQQNTFIFTRLIFGLSEYVNLSVEIPNFLENSLDIFHTDGSIEKTTRAKLISLVILQEMDSDSDKHASRGCSKKLQPESDRHSMSYVLGCLRRLKELGCTLTSLIFTLDEQATGQVRHVEFENAPRWNSWIQTPQTDSRTGLRVKYLTIRGANPLPNTRQGPEEGTAAKAIESWLSTHNISPQTIEYSGQFTATRHEGGEDRIAHSNCCLRIMAEVLGYSGAGGYKALEWLGYLTSGLHSVPTSGVRHSIVWVSKDKTVAGTTPGVHHLGAWE